MQRLYFTLTKLERGNLTEEIQNNDLLATIVRNYRIDSIPIDEVNNENYFESILEQDGLAIRFASDEIKNNERLCKIAADNDGNSIEYMSISIKNNKNVCKLAVANNGMSLKFMSDAMKNDEDVCKIAAKSNGCALQFMSETIKENDEICKIAIKNNKNAIQFASDTLKTNKEFCRSILKQWGMAIKSMTNEIKNDIDLCKIAFESNNCSFEFMGDDIKSNFWFCLDAIQKNPFMYDHCAASITDNKLILAQAIKHMHLETYGERKIVSYNKLKKQKGNCVYEYTGYCKQLAALYSANNEFFNTGQNDKLFDCIVYHLMDDFVFRGHA
jgi:hypothetical protein